MTETDHKAVLRSLPSDVTIALTQRKDRPGLLHLLGHLGLTIGIGAAIAWRVPFWPLLLPVQGVLLCFLFTLEHEATHQTPFATRWINEAVGHACGVVILLPFLWFRAFHMAHHRHTNDPERDPELLAGGHPTTRQAYLIHVSGLPYYWSMAQVILRNALGKNTDEFIPARQRPFVAREAQVYLMVYVLAALSLALSPVILWVWLIPILLGQPALRLYLLAEHGRCAYVANMLANTRTTYTNRAIRFIAWNMPFHIEHHSMPNVPFHHLPELHARMASHLHITSPGYAAFTRDYARALDANS